MPRTRLIDSPALRITLMMSCLFCANGVAMPFLPQWLAQERGLSGVEIGTVLCSAPVLRVLIGPPIASWADGFADRRTPLRILACAAAVFYALFFSMRDYAGLVAAAFCALACSAALTPLIEGAALRAARGGDIGFGVSRGLASSGFVLGSFTGGALIASFGIAAAPAFLLGMMTLLALVAAFAVKSDPAPPHAAGMGFRGRLRQAARLLKRRRFALAVLAAGLIQAAHAFLYSFSTLAWTAQGLNADVIGALWAFAVIVEVAFLSTLRLTEARIAPERLLLIGGAAAVLRWTAMAFAPPLVLLWPLQMLHAATFAATHVGALRIVERETPPEVAGLGMTLYAALAAGTPLGLATLASGALFDRYGAGGYAAMAVLAGCGLIAAIAMTRAPAREDAAPAL